MTAQTKDRSPPFVFVWSFIFLPLLTTHLFCFPLNTLFSTRFIPCKSPEAPSAVSPHLREDLLLSLWQFFYSQILSEREIRIWHDQLKVLTSLLSFFCSSVSLALFCLFLAASFSRRCLAISISSQSVEHTSRLTFDAENSLVIRQGIVTKWFSPLSHHAPMSHRILCENNSLWEETDNSLWEGTVGVIEEDTLRTPSTETVEWAAAPMAMNSLISSILLTWWKSLMGYCCRHFARRAWTSVRLFFWTNEDHPVWWWKRQKM